mmetsp:Transcript_11355/g.35898  ORF Transcript_11355/g.35898 Transcript_11355/m.35898 type:complete len:89 (-) Transcript_11355:39-305(-)
MARCWRQASSSIGLPSRRASGAAPSPDMGAHGWRSFRASDSRLGRELDSAWRAIQAELGDGQGDTEVRILRLPLGSVAPATSAHRPPA